MRHLFSREGEQALATVLRLQPLLAFDFDGTLAPIVAQPQDAHVSVAVARRLARLTRLLPVAIITGRSVADVRERLGFEPHFVIGSHGAENPAGASPAADRALLDGLRARIAEQAAALNVAGVQVEDKTYSLAFHYRLARDSELALGLIESLLQGLGQGLKVFGGKCVVNVVPAHAPDKADALAGLVQEVGTGAAMFVGDDVNDEVVFARAEPGWLTVRVGRDDPLSQAAFFLDSPAEIAPMLQRMLNQLGAK